MKTVRRKAVLPLELMTFLEGNWHGHSCIRYVTNISPKAKFKAKVGLSPTDTATSQQWQWHGFFLSGYDVSNLTIILHPTQYSRLCIDPGHCVGAREAENTWRLFCNVVLSFFRGEPKHILRNFIRKKPFLRNHSLALRTPYCTSVWPKLWVSRAPPKLRY